MSINGGVGGGGALLSDLSLSREPKSREDDEAPSRSREVHQVAASQSLQ